MDTEKLFLVVQKLLFIVKNLLQCMEASLKSQNRAVDNFYKLGRSLQLRHNYFFSKTCLGITMGDTYETTNNFSVALFMVFESLYQYLVAPDLI